MSQLETGSVIRQPDDDWRAVTDPAVRRRLQNKLNQRAQRTSTAHVSFADPLR